MKKPIFIFSFIGIIKKSFTLVLEDKIEDLIIPPMGCVKSLVSSSVSYIMIYFFSYSKLSFYMKSLFGL